MLFQCPICKSLLECERIDDGFYLYEISADGEVQETSSKSNGFTIVRCKKDASHKIPEDLIDAVIDMIY